MFKSLMNILSWKMKNTNSTVPPPLNADCNSGQVAIMEHAVCLESSVPGEDEKMTSKGSE